MQNAEKKVWEAPKVTVVDFSQTLGGDGNASEKSQGIGLGLNKRMGS
jgi:hypothetical protein